jgi:hypothetical protein
MKRLFLQLRNESNNSRFPTVFIGRDTEVIQLVYCLIVNQLAISLKQESWQNYLRIPVSNQSKGSGKTTFGINCQEYLRNNKCLQEKIVEAVKTEYDFKIELIEKELNNFLNAKYILVDLSSSRNEMASLYHIISGVVEDFEHTNYGNSRDAHFWLIFFRITKISQGDKKNIRRANTTYWTSYFYSY